MYIVGLLSFVIGIFFGLKLCESAIRYDINRRGFFETLGSKYRIVGHVQIRVRSSSWEREQDGKDGKPISSSAPANNKEQP